MDSITIPVGDIADRYDAVIIGSGYGGGIAASRLSRAGRRVLILERGREILVGDYPDTIIEATENAQFHTPDCHIGSRLGLYDIHVNKQQNVVVGCGLGGTSLINANVSLEAKPEVFEDPAWPQAFLDDKDVLLKEGLAHARQMLKPNPLPDSISLPKTRANEKSAGSMGQEFYRPPINVNFDTLPEGKNHVGVEQPPCNMCGDCVSGCNVGAKNTTLMNYLPDAWNHGADIVCQTDVRHIEKTDDGWLVHFQYVDVGREKFDAPTLFVKADIVVVSAGTMGSNEIMLRSRKLGLATSDRLGKDFSGNGDILGFGYNCDQSINGIGFGTHKKGEIPDVGPCITSIIDMRHGDDWRDRMVIEEGSIPGALAVTLPAAFSAAAGTIGQDTDSGIIDAVREKARIADSFLRGPYNGAVNHTQTYLIMSHDNAKGQAELNDGDRMVIDWPGVGTQSNFIKGNENLLQATKALGGEYVENPVWTPLFNESLITVHPLGGCNMAEDAGTGVVNHKGQVFTGQGDEVHKGLYITDGSVIPTSLAVNPLLTISAVSERCLRLMADDYGWTIDYRLPSKPTRPHPEKKPGIRFTETMQGFYSSPAQPGEDLQTYRDAAAQGKNDSSAIDFTLTIASHDLEKLLTDPDHPAKIAGTVNCSVLSAEPFTVSDGVFNLFKRMPSPPDTRHMIYSMQLHSEDGRSYFFKGYKVVKDDPDVLDIWPDTSTLYVSIFAGDSESAPLLGKAVMHIEPTDFARQMTTMAVTNATSEKQKLEALARFGKYFAGVLWESYGGIFYNPDRTPKPPRKQRPLRVDAPEVYPFKTEDGVDLRLTRYRGGDKGPVMLVHGLGVASTIFSTDLIDTNLLEYLYAKGYDVWLLDYRVSILLPAAEQSSNGDQVAQYDYPAAIKEIQRVTGSPDVQAVVHCYGGTTFFMSMLAGLQGVRSIVCSQIASDIVVPTATQIKTGLHVPGFLDRLGVDSLTARVPDGGGSVFTHLYDKALSVYALAEAQGNCTSEPCHRITFMYASLYRHDTLNDRLHANLDELFAESNMETFKHLAEMCRQGRLVSAAGDDIYMPHMARLNLPILFISGEDNECYLPQSTKITYDRLCQQFGTDQYARQVIPGYGHIDCIFGARASQDVFPYIVQHLDKTAAH